MELKKLKQHKIFNLISFFSDFFTSHLTINLLKLEPKLEP